MTLHRELAEAFSRLDVFAKELAHKAEQVATLIAERDGLMRRAREWESNSDGWQALYLKTEKERDAYREFYEAMECEGRKQTAGARNRQINEARATIVKLRAAPTPWDKEPHESRDVGPCCVECRRVQGDGPGIDTCAYRWACDCHDPDREGAHVTSPDPTDGSSGGRT